MFAAAAACQKNQAASGASRFKETSCVKETEACASAIGKTVQQPSLVCETVQIMQPVFGTGRQ